MDSKSKLFKEEEKKFFVVVKYSGQMSSMRAKDLGEAIVGMDYCMRKAGVLGSLDFDDVFILPIEEGSVKTTFLYIKNNPWKIVSRSNNVAGLLSASIMAIQLFGANNFRIPTKDIIDRIGDPKVLELCQGFQYRKSLQKVASPLGEYNEKVEIVIGNESVVINCENKYRFYVDKENEQILPDLINGEKRTLRGEIYRINKDNNDLGFKYNGRHISVTPLDEEKNTKEFHQYLDPSEVLLTGIVERSSMYETPSIRVINIVESKQNLFKFYKVGGEN